MGVRTKTVKKSARVIIEKYYSRLTLDFHTNKRVTGEVAIIPSKRMRNKIAGFVTHLMKRIAKGPVRGISLKLQEEERERRMDFVPERSAIEQDVIVIDSDTKDMLEVRPPRVSPLFLFLSVASSLSLPLFLFPFLSSSLPLPLFLSSFSLFLLFSLPPSISPVLSPPSDPVPLLLFLSPSTSRT